MQAGRLVHHQMVAEAEERDTAEPLKGHTPANRRFADRLQAAIAKREARAAAKTCADIAPRDSRGRFA